jgi:hypothetical protein
MSGAPRVDPSVRLFRTILCSVRDLREVNLVGAGLGGFVYVEPPARGPHRSIDSSSSRSSSVGRTPAVPLAICLRPRAIGNLEADRSA